MSTQSETQTPVIYTLLKLVERKEYAEQILMGSLRMHSVRYFKEYRDAAGELRGDCYEGVNQILQPSKISELCLGDVRVAPSELAGPLLTSRSDHLDWRVFCLYALGSNAVGHNAAFETWDDLKMALLPDQRCSALGSYVVCFTNPQEFLDRAAAAFRKLGVNGGFGLVEYYDERTFHGSFAEDDVPFRKRLRYASQREYRLAFEPHDGHPEPYILDLGDLSDVAAVAPLSDFCSQFSVGPADEAKSIPEKPAG